MFLIQLLAAFRTEKRLVRVESLDLHEPVVRIQVFPDETQARVERLRLGKIGITLNGGPVLQVLEVPGISNGILAERAGHRLGICHLASPRIPLLATETFERVVLGVVVGSSRFEIVIMIRGQMRINSTIL